MPDSETGHRVPKPVNGQVLYLRLLANQLEVALPQIRALWVAACRCHENETRSSLASCPMLAKGFDRYPPYLDSSLRGVGFQRPDRRRSIYLAESLRNGDRAG